MEDQSKSWWQSKGVWGSLATILIMLGSLFGIDFGDVQSLVDALEKTVLQISVVVTGLISLWGRLKAITRIK